MSKNKWMSQLTKGMAQAAADLPRPSENVVKLPSPSLNWVVGNGGITLLGKEAQGCQERLLGLR